MISTAQRFSDELNARRVIREHAFDEEHADALLNLLSMQLEDIQSRHMVGAKELEIGEGHRAFEFIDGSVAVRDDQTMRWADAAWSEA